MLNFLDRFFKISERGSTFRMEIMGGMITFFTMAYIIFVNPAILSDTGMDQGAVMTVTILATIIGTLIFAFLGKAPFVLGPGMGLNAFFTYSLVLGEGISWQQALGVVFISGCVFLILALTGLRKTIARAIPRELTSAAAAGIGVFLAFVGLKNMGIIVSNPDTLVALGEFSPTVLLSFFGIALMAILEVRQVKGGMLISIIVTTLLGVLIGDVDLPKQVISMPPSIAPVAFQLDILGALKVSLIGSIFSFMFIDMFDSITFLMACCRQMGLEDENGEIKGLDRMLYADVSATIIGSLLGTSTVTSLCESAAGIAAGARTGFASIITVILLALTLLFTPLLGMVPTYAASPALVIVGVFMFSNIKAIDLNNYKIAIPAFLTIILMPLTYSISIGLCFGFIAYILLHVVSGAYHKVSKVLWIIGVLCTLNLILA